SGLMTGYYEPLLHGSLEKSERFRYPVYGQPEDLLEIDLVSIFPELKGKRVRGKLVGNKVVPYEARGEMDETKAPVLCWVDDKVSLFFLEVQGSGRIALDNGETLFVGYRNQNGHRYRSIGKYLIDQGEIEREKVSLQSIRRWLDENPDRIDEVLNHNPSLVFFQNRPHAASGAMGLELTPGRSVAVDKRYIPLGSMLYVKADDPLEGTPLDRVVFAQDTGGAIKGELRADFFWGFGKEAEAKAGRMKADTEFWILLPKAEIR
ncbi:MAG: MltA domain-containing protein, partial [Sulfurimonadaceae bacterium]|nr:MltA domain-containing protein [Sulfurimonadaceae bacterium]